MTECKIATKKQTGHLYLFDPVRLTELSTWTETVDNLREKNLLARPLKSTDYNAGYLDLLSQLTEVGEVTEDDFLKRFNLMKSINEVDEHYAIVVIEDTNSQKVIGAASLVMELKFIHQCAMRGRIEEVVVLDSYRGKKVGETVVKILVDLAKEIYKCYKISLDCSDNLVKFYGKNGLYPDKNMLIRYFDR